MVRGGVSDVPQHGPGALRWEYLLRSEGFVKVVRAGIYGSHCSLQAAPRSPHLPGGSEAPLPTRSESRSRFYLRPKTAPRRQSCALRTLPQAAR